MGVSTALPTREPEEASGTEGRRLAAACQAAVAEVHHRCFQTGTAHAARALGVLCYSAGLFADAAPAFQEAIRRRPRAEDFYLLGLSHMGQEAWAEALAAFRLAIAADPDAFMAYYQIARVSRRQKSFDRALEILGQAHRRFEGTTYEGFLENEMGLTLEEQGRLPDALRLLEGAARVATGDAVPVQVNLAVVLYKLGRLAEARDILDAIVHRGAGRAVLHPSTQTSFLVYYTLGSIALDEGQAARAYSLLEHAVSLAPDSAPAWNTLAIARVATGDRRAAMDALRRALDIAPQMPAARRNLARLEEQEAREAPRSPA